ncbi:hypothetical protein Naga_101439g1, partial [Nannochloropsis gaditana]
AILCRILFAPPTPLPLPLAETQTLSARLRSVMMDLLEFKLPGGIPGREPRVRLLAVLAQYAGSIGSSEEATEQVVGDLLHLLQGELDGSTAPPFSPPLSPTPALLGGGLLTEYDDADLVARRKRRVVREGAGAVRLVVQALQQVGVGAWLGARGLPAEGRGSPDARGGFPALFLSHVPAVHTYQGPNLSFPFHTPPPLPSPQMALAVPGAGPQVLAVLERSQERLEGEEEDSGSVPAAVYRQALELARRRIQAGRRASPWASGRDLPPECFPPADDGEDEPALDARAALRRSMLGRRVGARMPPTRAGGDSDRAQAANVFMALGATAPFALTGGSDPVHVVVEKVQVRAWKGNVGREGAHGLEGGPRRSLCDRRRTRGGNSDGSSSG